MSFVLAELIDGVKQSLTAMDSVLLWAGSSGALVYAFFDHKDTREEIRASKGWKRKALCLKLFLLWTVPTVGLLGAYASSLSEAKSEKTINDLRTNVATLAKRTARADSRMLADTEVAPVVASLKEFRGQHFWIIIQTQDYDRFSEQVRFARQLEQILLSAEWVKGKIGLPIYRRIGDRGIEVGSGTAIGAQRAAHAVRDALAQCSISLREPSPVFNDVESDLVLIDVGLK